MFASIDKHKLNISPHQYGWALLIWMIGGFISILTSFGIWLVLTETAELVLATVSLAIGLLMFSWTAVHPDAKAKLRALSLFKRIAVILFAPVFYAWLTMANLYQIAHLVHLATSTRATTSYTISSKGQEWRPWRCKHYVLFQEIRIIYLKKACVSAEEFEEVRRGTTVVVNGTASGIGFKAEEISLIRRANLSSSGRAKSARRST